MRFWATVTKVPSNFFTFFPRVSQSQTYARTRKVAQAGCVIYGSVISKHPNDSKGYNKYTFYICVYLFNYLLFRSWKRFYKRLQPKQSHLGLPIQFSIKQTNFKKVRNKTCNNYLRQVINDDSSILLMNQHQLRARAGRNSTKVYTLRKKRNGDVLSPIWEQLLALKPRGVHKNTAGK